MRGDYLPCLEVPVGDHVCARNGRRGQREAMREDSGPSAHGSLQVQRMKIVGAENFQTGLKQDTLRHRIHATRLLGVLARRADRQRLLVAARAAPR